MPRQTVRLAVLALVGSLLPGAALAAPGERPGIKLGAAALHPSYAFSAAYDSNIYLAPPDEGGNAVAGGGVRGSWILTNAAGLKLDLPVGHRHKVTADYKVRHEHYQVLPSANNAVHQNADLSWDFKGSKTKARVFDSYVNTRDRQFDPNSQAVAGELVDREARWQNTAGLSGEYYLGEKFFLGGDAQDTVHKYVGGALGAGLNRSEVLFGLKTGYLVAPKTRVFVGGRRQLVHYSAGRPANHKDWLADVGVEGQLLPKVKGQAQAGFQYREYDPDDPVLIRTTVARAWQASARLTYTPEEYMDWVLTVLRSLNETASNASGGGYYTSTGISFDSIRRYERWSWGLTGAYQRDHYSEAITLGSLTAVRRDDSYSGGLKADYYLRDWLSVGASWKRVVRRSNFTRELSYKDSLTTVGVKAAF